MLKIKEKNEIMTIDEIRAYYPKEWVIIANPESDSDFNVIPIYPEKYPKHNLIKT